MRAMSNFFAIVFAIIAVVAFIGALQGATWHYGTTIMCIVLAFIFWEEDRTPSSPGLSGK